MCWSPTFMSDLPLPDIPLPFSLCLVPHPSHLQYVSPLRDLLLLSFSPLFTHFPYPWLGKSRKGEGWESIRYSEQKRKESETLSFHTLSKYWWSTYCAQMQSTRSACFVLPLSFMGKPGIQQESAILTAKLFDPGNKGCGGTLGTGKKELAEAAEYLIKGPEREREMEGGREGGRSCCVWGKKPSGWRHGACKGGCLEMKSGCSQGTYHLKGVHASGRCLAWTLRAGGHNGNKLGGSNNWICDTGTSLWLQGKARPADLGSVPIFSVLGWALRVAKPSLWKPAALWKLSAFSGPKNWNQKRSPLARLF